MQLTRQTAKKLMQQNENRLSIAENFKNET